MSSLRTHDDTWDIATSVGSTAVLVAAARAAETVVGLTNSYRICPDRRGVYVPNGPAAAQPVLPGARMGANRESVGAGR